MRRPAIMSCSSRPSAWGKARQLSPTWSTSFLCSSCRVLAIELQGIKKGVFELADALVVNKADGDGEHSAKVALADLKAALRYLPRKRSIWQPRALAASGLTGLGIDELWTTIDEHRQLLASTGELASLRAAQQSTWMWTLIRERLEDVFRKHPDVATTLPRLERAVKAGTTTSSAAADELLAIFGREQI